MTNTVLGMLFVTSFDIVEAAPLLMATLAQQPELNKPLAHVLVLYLKEKLSIFILIVDILLD